MNELTDTKLARPLDKSVMGNDIATLRALTAQLNDPRLTGAVVEPEEKYDGAAGANGETMPPVVIPDTDEPGVIPFPHRPPQTLPVQPPPPPRVPSTPAVPSLNNTVAPSARLLFTGRGIADVIAAIGATEIPLYAPAKLLADSFFGSANPEPEGFAALIKTIIAWGAAEFSTAYPVTPARACFVTMIKSMAAGNFLPLAGITSAGLPILQWENFGRDAGFWVDACEKLAQAQAGYRVAITGITSKMEFDYFRARGFQHWHVMARPDAKSTDAIANSLDNDVTKQISAQRNGAKLRCIWRDTTPPASNRLWTLAEFVAAAAAPNPSSINME